VHRRYSACAGNHLARTVHYVALPYPPFHVEVTTPRLKLRGATDDLLERLIPIVREGVVQGDEVPFDDPISHYEPSPTREWRWLRAIWSARARTEATWWRLCFAVDVGGEMVGMQDLIAEDFSTFGVVTTFSWLAPGARGRGIGREMRAAILHLAFAGLSAREATSEAFLDNTASNAISRALGYQENGTAWATRRASPCQLRRWTLPRERWETSPRTDIVLSGVEPCLPLLGLT
jgi:RimJ/RimL family protein N-acetyltransferase